MVQIDLFHLAGSVRALLVDGQRRALAVRLVSLRVAARQAGADHQTVPAGNITGKAGSRKLHNRQVPAAEPKLVLIRYGLFIVLTYES